MPIGFDLQSQLIADAELKYLAQKSFISYLRSVHLKADKQVSESRFASACTRQAD